MKIDWKSKETRIAVTAFVTVAAIIIFSRVIDDIDDLLGIVSMVVSEGFKVLLPFILGALVSYILLPVVRLFDGKILKKILRGDKFRRGVSVLLTYVLLLAGIAWLISYLVPILVSNVQDFIKHLPGYLETAEKIAARIVEEIPMLGVPAVEKAAENALASIGDMVESSAEQLVQAVPGAVMKVTGVVTDTFITLMTSIYLLIDMDRIKVSAKRLTRSLFVEKRADKVLQFVHDADRIFGQYVRARLVTSTLVLILTFIGFTAYGVPYAMLFALVAGITNIVPFFGPIVGFLITVFMVLLISPDKTIYAGAFVTILQQLEGYLIDPMIMGDSVDLRPFWVLLAVSVGGVFGLPGMVLGVPVAAFIGTQLSRFTASRVGPKPSAPEKKHWFHFKK